MDFEPIVLRYEGLDADRHEIELSQLGSSLHGAAQIIGSAAHVVATGQYAKTAIAVRILAGVPKNGSWELPAIIHEAHGIAMSVPLFPVIADIGKKSGYQSRDERHFLRTRKSRSKKRHEGRIGGRGESTFRNGAHVSSRN